MDVSFKLAGRLVVPVRAVFTAPEPRTVVMHLTDGEGEGSVVETHATPLGPDDRGRPRTMVVEAVVASSDRRGFAVARATTSPARSGAGSCAPPVDPPADGGWPGLPGTHDAVCHAGQRTVQAPARYAGSVHHAGGRPQAEAPLARGPLHVKGPSCPRSAPGRR